MKEKSSYRILLPFLALILFVALPVNANAWDRNKGTSLRVSQISRDTVFSFDKQRSGTIPVGWTNVSGNWIVDQDDKGNFLAQIAENGGMSFNVAVFDEDILKDVELSIDIRAKRGEEDQGGGLIWRYMDSNNYYIVRFNPLEDNFRLYKVLNGQRIQLSSASGTVPKGSWFNIEVVMKGSEVTCYLNGKKLIHKTDDTFVKPGKIGFWTKADAVSDFDNFNIKGD